MPWKSWLHVTCCYLFHRFLKFDTLRTQCRVRIFSLAKLNASLIISWWRNTVLSWCTSMLHCVSSHSQTIKANLSKYRSACQIVHSHSFADGIALTETTNFGVDEAENELRLLAKRTRKICGFSSTRHSLIYQDFLRKFPAWIFEGNGGTIEGNYWYPVSIYPPSFLTWGATSVQARLLSDFNMLSTK